MTALGQPTAPRYGQSTLAEVLPAVARSLGVDLPGAHPQALVVPESRQACVLLIDGLGDHLLRDRAGHAPFFRKHLDRSVTLTAGFPTTTATSMGSFGTGLPPGSHGLVGYEVLIPESQELLNLLSWEPPVNPRLWQPETTVFQKAAATGMDVVRIGPAYFDGSGLTEAALRGGTFIAASSLEDRVAAALAVLRRGRPALVYVYWGEVDKTGHEWGCSSWQWGAELSTIDSAVADLARGLPAGAALHITADHGMVDVPHHQRIDVRLEPELRRGVRSVGGEPRCPQVYAEPGQAVAVAARWAKVLGDRATVISQEEAVAKGWFGKVSPQVLQRIGDPLVMCAPGVAVIDPDRMRPQALALIGHHGSWTEQESKIPFLTIPAGG